MSDAFNFKRFSVFHAESSMKVSQESILLGAWTDINGRKRILDAGCGCGLLALMMAQRTESETEILAIDIDEASVEESKVNFHNSPWGERLTADLKSFDNINEECFDLIISNPPYFQSGKKELYTSREIARHQSTLSPSALLRGGKKILNNGGSVAMVVPTDQVTFLITEGVKLGYRLRRECKIRGRIDLHAKRSLLQFVLDEGSRKGEIGDRESEGEEVIVREAKGEYTEDFKRLTKDFYKIF